MQNFQYHNPTRIVFGKGTIQELAKLLNKNQKILMIMGSGSIKQNGVYDQVKTALKGFRVVEFWGIQPNPEYDDCMKAVQLAKEEEIDFLLSVGGGSVLDATKFIAVAMNDEGEDPWDILLQGRPIHSAKPLADVLTLPATGSEANGNSVISRRSVGQKLAFSSPLVMPQFSILDPETTMTLSERQTANGIVDAFVHVMEQYLTYDVKTPLQDRQAEAILSTLIDVAPRIQANPKDYDARAEIMWCATNALNGLIGCGVVQDWSTHMIGHELTAMHGLDHAQTLAIVLPAMMQHQRKQKGGKIMQCGKRVWGLKEEGDTLVDATITKTAEFFAATGCPTRLSDYRLTFEACASIPKILGDRVGKIGEHGDIGEKEIEAILKLAE